MSRRYREKRVRLHWIYSRAELRAVYDVCDRTLSNWIERGLQQIDNCRPQLFAGGEVQRFIRRQNLANNSFDRRGRLLCKTCQDLRQVDGQHVKWSADGLMRERLHTICPVCEALIEHHYTAENAALLRRRLARSVEPTGKTSRHDTDYTGGRTSSGVAGSGLPAIPEACSINLRLLHAATMEWIERDQVARKTIDERLRAIARLSTHRGSKPFTRYTKDDAIAFRETLASCVRSEAGDGYSLSTISHTLDHCRHFFEWLAKQGHADASDLAEYFRPPRGMRRVAIDEGLKDGKLWADVVAVFDAMRASTPMERRNKAIFALIALTGMRADAIASIPRFAVDRASLSVDQGAGTMRTKNSKRVRTFIVAINEDMLAALGDWLDEFDKLGFAPSAPLFPPNIAITNMLDREGDPNPKPWSCGSQISRILREACTRAGFAPGYITPHDLRRSIVPHMMERGLTLEQMCAVSQNFAHADVPTTLQHYGRLPEGRRRDVLRSIAQTPPAGEDILLALAAALRMIRKDDPRHASSEMALARVSPTLHQMFGEGRRLET